MADEFYFKAFWDLTTCRKYDGSTIPWDAMAQYTDRCGMQADVADMFAHIIRLMDNVYLKDKQETQEKASRISSRGSGRPGKSVKKR